MKRTKSTTPAKSQARKQSIVITAAGTKFVGFTSAHELLGFTEIYADTAQILAAAVQVIQDTWKVKLQVPNLPAPKVPTPAPVAKPAKRRVTQAKPATP